MTQATKQEIMAMFIDDTAARKCAIIRFIQDERNSYEDRLEVYMCTPDHLKNNISYYIRLDDYENKYGEISWYDDFYVERYQVVDLTTLYLDEDWTEEQKKDFYLNCMKQGVHIFQYDW